MILDLLILVLSVGILIFGAELLVRGAARLALRIGVSPFVIGVTVVGFGTSAPELAASIASATSGHGEIAVGNVIGSNIMNIALVLGLTAMVMPIPVSRVVVQREVIVTITVAFVPFLALPRGGMVERPLGAAMIAALAGFLYWTFRASRKEGGMPIEAEVPDAPPRGAWRSVIDVVLVLIGIGMQVFGAELLVESATSIARALGISELVIGLTIVAGGTSAPELATSLMAVLRGRSDLGVGNILGSCVFNLLGILGITALVQPVTIPPEAFLFDIPVMIVCALACLPILFTGHRISRGEGTALFAGFVIYTTLLFVGWPFPADRGQTDDSSTPATPAERSQLDPEAPVTATLTSILRHQRPADSS